MNHNTIASLESLKRFTRLNITKMGRMIGIIYIYPIQVIVTKSVIISHLNKNSWKCHLEGIY